MITSVLSTGKQSDASDLSGVTQDPSTSSVHLVQGSSIYQTKARIFTITNDRKPFFLDRIVVNFSKIYLV